MNDYQKYLNSIHSQNTTNDDVISGALKEFTNKEIANKRRIIAGEDNEVYDIELSDETHLIVRISRAEKNEFDQESWAIGKCGALGIPVPKVLGIKHIIYESKPLHICIQEKLEGEPLERGSLDFNIFSDDRKKSIIFQAGELLSKIHSIETNGFGELDSTGRGVHANFSDLIQERIDQEEKYLLIAKEINFDYGQMKNAIKTLKEWPKMLQFVQPVLNHNDFGPKHIMIKNDKIVGILDFGEVSGNSPINDFANWDYWFGGDLPIAWLAEGYQNKELFTGDFENTLHLFRINNGLGILSWYFDKKYVEGVESAKVKLLKDLSYFNSL